MNCPFCDGIFQRFISWFWPSRPKEFIQEEHDIKGGRASKPTAPKPNYIPPSQR